MLKKTITFENLDGEKVTRDFYFNLSKADIMKLDLKERAKNKNKGLEQKVAKMQQEEDINGIYDFFENLVRKSIGKKNDDLGFVKNPEYADAFINSDAYSVLLLELLEDEAKAADFIYSIMPNDISAEAKKKLAEQLQKAE